MENRAKGRMIKHFLQCSVGPHIPKERKKKEKTLEPRSERISILYRWILSDFLQKGLWLPVPDGRKRAL